MQRAFSFRVESVKMVSACFLVLAVLALLFCFRVAAISYGSGLLAAPSVRAQARILPAPVSEARAFITYREVNAVGCREASPTEAQTVRERGAQSMHRISPARLNRNPTLEAAAIGLQIILRGTDQLESFPAAKAAFLNAAARWEARITSPITVIVDVDFGATWFGQTYPASVLGQTDSQTLGDSEIYSDVRSQLVTLASSDGRAALYNQLPASQVPTDQGATSYVLAPSALWRALGFLNAAADPDAEVSFGNPPAVGFNSAFDYDFDPSDGIDTDAIDFDAVAVHEIGHVLGFDSFTGYRELVGSAPVAVSVWDLFRLRLGATLATFNTAPRVLASGGSQIFFDGSGQTALSTGRPDGTGGDGEQASHWKDNRFTGQQIGVMDPTLADGVRETISDSDLTALFLMGYGVGTATQDDAPTISKAFFNGNKLKLKGTGFTGILALEINGLDLSSTLSPTSNATDKKLTFKATQSALNLHSGVNQIRIRRNGVSSNLFTLIL